MSVSLICALLWFVFANVLAMFPSRDQHWRTAYVLIAIGLPLLAWVFWVEGVWIALILLVAAASILRWPVLFAWRWVKRALGSK